VSSGAEQSVALLKRRWHEMTMSSWTAPAFRERAPARQLSVALAPQGRDPGNARRLNSAQAPLRHPSALRCVIEAGRADPGVVEPQPQIIGVEAHVMAEAMMGNTPRTSLGQ